MEADHHCPVCTRYFKTSHGLNSHLKTSRSCSWWKRGKLAEVMEELDDEDLHGGAIGVQEGDQGNPYYFINVPPNAADEELFGQPGPGPSSQANQSRCLDEDDDEWHEEKDVGAGKVIRMDECLHDCWHQLFREQDGDGDVVMRDDDGATTDKDNYAPFASEMDWRVAQWMVKDRIGHKSFDRFLAIPGVHLRPSSEKLGLSFHNTHSLHQKIDLIPECAGLWSTKSLTFNDRPGYTYTI
ncbi:hypothetical protein L208DRAFT_1292600 [Tricholoma matsutake]|nr:hypothetical protein L208DRAFT_1292600 [Tricholoma matsutake 945]